jgi:predicted nucleic acid-binding protein
VILLDSNVLVYAVAGNRRYAASCRSVVSRALQRRLEAVLVPQVLLEFFAVVTSPRRVENPISPRDALDQIEDLRARIPLLEVTVKCFAEWTRLARGSNRRGAGAFDLFLAAQMIAHGVPEICTVDVADFRLPGITARDPAGL